MPGRLTQELRGVFNAGIGVQHVVNEDVSVYGAFHTDFSASVGDPAVNVSVSDWDLYHLSGGASFRLRDNRFTLGRLLGHRQPEAPDGLDDPPEIVPAAGLDSERR